MAAVCSRRSACTVCRCVLKNCSGTPRTTMRARVRPRCSVVPTRGSRGVGALEDRETAEDHRAVLVWHRRVRVRRMVEVWRVTGVRQPQRLAEGRRLVQVGTARPEAIDLLHPDDVGIETADHVDRGLQIEATVSGRGLPWLAGWRGTRLVGLPVLDVVGHDPQRAVAGLRFRLRVGSSRDGNHRHRGTGKQIVSRTVHRTSWVGHTVTHFQEARQSRPRECAVNHRSRGSTCCSARRRPAGRRWRTGCRPAGAGAAPGWRRPSRCGRATCRTRGPSARRESS